MPTMTLPLPVSTNRLWRAGRGRVHRSPQYRAWLTEAGWELRAQRSTVPLNDPIDEALHPDYLRGFINYAKLEPGDEIVLRAVDFSWQAELTVIRRREDRILFTLAVDFMSGSVSNTCEHFALQDWPLRLNHVRAAR